MKRRKQIKIPITKGISFSKTRSEWICSWCQEPIVVGEETLLFSGLDKHTDGRVYTKGFGARIHLKCIPLMCDDLKEVEKDRGKYAIVSELDVE